MRALDGASASSSAPEAASAPRPGAFACIRRAFRPKRLYPLGAAGALSAFGKVRRV